MKKHVAVAALLAVVALVSLGTLALAGDDAKNTTQPSTWTGWITDEQCGAKNASAEGAACTLKCAKNGIKLVLYVEDGKKLVGLDDQAEALKHVGAPVTVTGTLEDGVIKVQKIEDHKG